MVFRREELVEVGHSSEELVCQVRLPRSTLSLLRAGWRERERERERERGSVCVCVRERVGGRGRELIRREGEECKEHKT